MASLPILTQRRERKAAELQAAIQTGVSNELEKAGYTPAANAPMATSGATYPFQPASPVRLVHNESNPLPRTLNTFDSLFGPGTPLYPDALDPLGPSGRADPRRYQYAPSWNIQLIDKEIPWSFLRKLATEVDVLSRCAELVQDAIAGMQWEWTFSPSIINQIKLENDEKNSGKAVALARDKYGDKLAMVQNFWERPDERMGYTFTQWLTLAVWNQLVYDAIPVYPQYTAGGDIHSFSILDPSTIKVLLDNQGFMPRPPAPAYQQILYGFPRGEFQAEALDDKGKIPNSYRHDQLAYFVRRPRPHTPYGFSTVEECINYATMYQQRQEWMHANWSSGSTPKGTIETSDTETWTPEQLGYFQTILNDQWSGQTQRRQQVMVLRPGMKWVQLKDEAQMYTVEYDQWLVLQIGSKFGVPQQQLGIPMAIHNLGNSGAATTTQMDITDKFALDALVNFLIDCFNDLARRFMGVGREITMTAHGGNTTTADVQQAQADAAMVNAGLKTRNEIRMQYGLPLITEPEADELGITTATGVTFIAGQLAEQELEMQALEAGIPTQGGTRQRSSVLDNRTDAETRPTRRSAGQPKSRSAGQPDAPAAAARRGAYVTKELPEKELVAFVTFAKGRIDKPWRDFEFRSIDEEIGTALNELGLEQDPEMVEEVVELIKAGVCTQDGPCDTSLIGTGKNWVTRVQGLPVYIRAIAHALLRSGESEAQAIATAVATVKRWAAGGGKVTEATRTRAAAAVKEWERKKEEAHETSSKSIALRIAGLAVKANDTGRVLMVQRSIDKNNKNAGKFEFPGGHIENDEDPLTAAKREWIEETGTSLPEGKIVGSWTTSAGCIYFVYVVKHEEDVTLATPDSLDELGDGEIENVVWWNINDLQSNPAVRPEVQSSDWALLGSAKKAIEGT